MSCALPIRPKYQNVIDMLNDFSDSGSTGQADESQLVHLQSTNECFNLREAISLNPVPAPIQRLRELEEGWDGRDADPPSELVLAHAEAFWSDFVDSFPASFQRPTVRMARDGYIAFSWVDQKLGKELHIWFHDDEPMAYEVHLRSRKSRLDKKQASLQDLANAVVIFFGS
jgi:hypothetical protein